MTTFPKPTRADKPAFVTHRDGSEVCSDTPSGWVEYGKRLDQMIERQGGKCAICRLVRKLCFGHERSRGGGKRDDRILHEDGKTWRNAALCYDCNGQQGSKRYHWIDNNREFVPAERGADGK
jgi:hypothetical protein